MKVEIVEHQTLAEKYLREEGGEAAIYTDPDSGVRVVLCRTRDVAKRVMSVFPKYGGFVHLDDGTTVVFLNGKLKDIKDLLFQPDI